MPPTCWTDAPIGAVEWFCHRRATSTVVASRAVGTAGCHAKRGAILASTARRAHVLTGHLPTESEVQINAPNDEIKVKPLPVLETSSSI